jgi:hypothetical protein
VEKSYSQAGLLDDYDNKVYEIVVDHQFNDDWNAQFGYSYTLFDELLARESDPWRAQDRLHQHCWPDRRHVSVLMSRATACTVSRTVVVIADEATTMSYAPVIDGWIGPVTEARLTRVRTLLAAAG